MTNATDTFACFKDLLAFVTKESENSLYRDLYATEGFDPESVETFEDIARVPLLAKTTLAQADTLRFIPWPEVLSVSPTGGTTSGKPLVTYYAPSEHAVRSAESDDLGTSLLLMNPMRAGSMLYFYFMREQLALLGDLRNLPATCQIASQIGTRTITTTPTVALMLKSHVDAFPALMESLRYVRLAGELITPQKKQRVAQLYPSCRIPAIYASGEAGRVAAQCPALMERMDAVWYHAPRAHNLVEIVSPETGERVADGTRGELVLTDFTNRATPFIRYRTGDEARIVPESCTCGSRDPLIELFGRIGHDSVRAGGFELRRDPIDAVLARLSDTVRPDFEARIEECIADTNPSLKVELRLMLREGVDESELVRKKIRDMFLAYWRMSPTLTAREAAERGLLEQLTLTFVEFEDSPKSVGKLLLA